VLATLKDELFALETERLEGRLNEAEYAEQKSAIEVVLKTGARAEGPGFVQYTGTRCMRTER